ncbi:MAG TPA: AmmeMemoRadiSam system protein B, partial [Spirochaetia bacterium]|nr:AmmeMemoRadiSam system protein B [Spirochaetia bacterium]
MRVRRRYLPPGWYPGNAEVARRKIEEMEEGIRPPSAAGIAGVVPHAGWEFSGRLALEVLKRLSPSMDTMVIIGGHLGPADGLLCAFEDSYDTPLGPVAADLELMEAIGSSIPLREDRYADNTVEVQLPFVRYLFPEVRVLGMRASPSRDAARLGVVVSDAAKRLGRRVAVIGSTDLTHYGAGYGFQPAGIGEHALKWVREVNDRRLIDSLLAMDLDASLSRALGERSACSAGGALAALSFAKTNGIQSGTLVCYATSQDVHPSESFV